MGRIRLLAVLAAGSALVLPAASAAAPVRLYYQDTLPKTGAGQVTVTTQRAASFRVLLHVPTQGRARLYLLGRKAPKGGPLIDTSTSACDGAAGSFYCSAAYEPLPRGTYTWRIVWKGAIRAPVELTIRW
jgi:hypothetical protein